MTKKKRRLILFSVGVIALFFLAIILWVCFVSWTRPAYVMPDTSSWQTGDIFFSVGDSWESVAVRSISGAKNFEVSDSTPSHCGIVIRDGCGVKLVHASTVAKRIVAETPEEFQKNNGSYCLYVIRVNQKPDSIAVRETADSLITNRIPFDFDFNHNDSKSLYCTEMVITIFERNGDSRFSPLREQSYVYPENILKISAAR